LVRIAACLEAAKQKQMTQDEKHRAEPIERLRAEMNALTRRFQRTDYGAGTQDSRRTQEEMQAGVRVTQTLGDFTRISSKSPFWCLFLFKLIRATRPSVCLELGTGVGISGAYQAAALEMNGQGKLTTMEGSPELSHIARANFVRLELGAVEVVTGRFQDTLPGVLQDAKSIDHVFIDGHHDGRATLSYFSQIRPFLTEKALVVLDDVAWSRDMTEAWQSIAGDDQVDLALDLDTMGLCVCHAQEPSRSAHDVPQYPKKESGRMLKKAQAQR
jgi:predicted O-methyltransferase YrrM